MQVPPGVTALAVGEESTGGGDEDREGHRREKREDAPREHHGQGRGEKKQEKQNMTCENIPGGSSDPRTVWNPSKSENQLLRVSRFLDGRH